MTQTVLVYLKKKLERPNEGHKGQQQSASPPPSEQNDDENLMDNLPNKEDSELWFIIAIVAISTSSILIIGIFIYCLQR